MSQKNLIKWAGAFGKSVKKIQKVQRPASKAAQRALAAVEEDEQSPCFEVGSHNSSVATSSVAAGPVAASSVPGSSVATGSIAASSDIDASSSSDRFSTVGSLADESPAPADDAFIAADDVSVAVGATTADAFNVSLAAYGNHNWRPGNRVVLPLTLERRVVELNMDEDIVLIDRASRLIHKLLEQHFPIQKTSGLGTTLGQFGETDFPHRVWECMKHIAGARNALIHDKPYQFHLHNPRKTEDAMLHVFSQLAPHWEIKHLHHGVAKVEKEFGDKIDEKDAENHKKDAEIKRLKSQKDAEMHEKDAEIKRLQNQLAQMITTSPRKRSNEYISLGEPSLEENTLPFSRKRFCRHE